MDINFLRNLIMLAALAAFIGIVWWAFTPSRKASLDQAARSVLEEDAS